MVKKSIAVGSKDKRQHILDAAMDYCAEYGLEPISVRAIAKHAKVNSALLGYYFGYKVPRQLASIDAQAFDGRVSAGIGAA